MWEKSTASSGVRRLLSAQPGGCGSRCHDNKRKAGGPAPSALWLKPPGVWTAKLPVLVQGGLQALPVGPPWRTGGVGSGTSGDTAQKGRHDRGGSLASRVETPGLQFRPCPRQWGDLGLSQDALKVSFLICKTRVRKTESLPYAVIERIKQGHMGGRGRGCRNEPLPWSWFDGGTKASSPASHLPPQGSGKVLDPPAQLLPGEQDGVRPHLPGLLGWSDRVIHRKRLTQCPGHKRISKRGGDFLC